MTEKRFPPDDPREWLNRAESSLVQARMEADGIYLEDLCFNAQQAAEKAIKGVLIHHNASFPYVHDLARLLALVQQAGVSVPTSIRRATQLTRYAVATRYPGTTEPVSRKEYEEAIAIAEDAVQWAHDLVRA